MLRGQLGLFSRLELQRKWISKNSYKICEERNLKMWNIIKQQSILYTKFHPLMYMYYSKLN